MAAKKVRQARKKPASPSRANAKKKPPARAKRPSSKAATRSLIPRKKAQRAAVETKPREPDTPLEPPVLPIPSATFTF